MTDQEKAIAAVKSGILSKTIVIKTNADLTPKGKRRAKFVTQSYTSRGKRPNHIAWYVGRSCYVRMAVTDENIEKTKQWIAKK